MEKMTNIRAACLVLIIFGFITPVLGVAQSASRKVDAYIQEQMAKRQIPGLAVAVVEDGKAVKLKGYGLSSIEYKQSVNENSIFQIYSTTKIFAGVAVMKLVEDGKLSLDAFEQRDAAAMFRNALEIDPTYKRDADALNQSSKKVKH